MPPRRFYTAMAGATLAIVAVRAWCWRADALETTLRGTFPLLWHEFAVGLAVFHRLNVARRAVLKRLIELGLGGQLIVGLTTQGEGTATAAGFALLLVALRRWDERCSDLRWLAPFRANGRRCYSSYLGHLPVIVVGNRWLFELGLTGFWARALVMVPLVSLAGVATGWAFHALVETHFLGPPPSAIGLGQAA